MTEKYLSSIRIDICLSRGNDIALCRDTSPDKLSLVEGDLPDLVENKLGRVCLTNKGLLETVWQEQN
jgi:hypothetical protein